MTIKEVEEIQSLQKTFVDILIGDGVDSPKLKEMLEANRHNSEWLRLAHAAIRMKRGIKPSRCPCCGR